MQKGVSISGSAEGCETQSWPLAARGGAREKASAETSMSDEKGANKETTRRSVAEVDHFSSLRAR
ncbi:MAG TPA: hypothetical protein VGC66_09505 [Pyrinomonadaceae bacterium]|jgi:hypothetical protein